MEVALMFRQFVTDCLMCVLIAALVLGPVAWWAFRLDKERPFPPASCSTDSDCVERFPVADPLACDYAHGTGLCDGTDPH